MGLYIPDAKIKLDPQIYVKTAQWNIEPWVCLQSDLLATDWGIADPPLVTLFRRHPVHLFKRAHAA